MAELARDREIKGHSRVVRLFARPVRIPRMAALAQLSRFFVRYRPRLARLTLILGLVFAFRALAGQWPRETELEFELGADHRDVIELRVSYFEHGEELHGVSFPFPDGAP